MFLYKNEGFCLNKFIKTQNELTRNMKMDI